MSHFKQELHHISTLGQKEDQRTTRRELCLNTLHFTVSLLLVRALEEFTDTKHLFIPFSEFIKTLRFLFFGTILPNYKFVTKKFELNTEKLTSFYDFLLILYFYTCYFYVYNFRKHLKRILCLRFVFFYSVHFNTID